ncbi:MAG: hypothetical protein GY835_25285 [bacterium]|nr:hypothetical protein [bacterium]
MKRIPDIKTLMLLMILIPTLLVVGCDEDSNPYSPAKIFEYSGTFRWDSEIGEDPQDVFDMNFKADTIVSLRATEVTGASVLQVALYGPGEPLGGTNLLTEDATELRCGWVDNCNNNTEGQTVIGFTIPETGTYRFAVTRDWGDSCGSSGTYYLHISSDTSFSGVTQTVNDEPSLAAEWSCP